MPSPDAYPKAADPAHRSFSGEYGRVTHLGPCAHEDPPIPEHLLQCIWYDQRFARDGIKTQEGQRLRIVSPGWWNRSRGPDFRRAQLEFNGNLKSGDVEIHFTPASWRAHGHDRDPHYDNVLLHVVLEMPAGSAPVFTSSGREIPTFVMGPCLGSPIETLAAELPLEDYPYRVEGAYGLCSYLIPEQGVEPLGRFLDLAGQWRMLNKAKALQERAATVGTGQALYEALLTACGYSAFKDQFYQLARHLPYERVRQLAGQDPLLLEAALFQLAGLVPDQLPDNAPGITHYRRIRTLLDESLAGLRPLGLIWERGGVRPANAPERRIAGVARILSRTSATGLVETLERVWREDLSPRNRRERFESLFPRPLGFWADYCSWTGKRLQGGAAPLGSGRRRSIIGNVFVPAALAAARARGDRRWEERILDFFEALPMEPENQILRAMAPRLLADAGDLRLNFQRQQGMLQVHSDWCAPNPSCRNCRAIQYLRR